MRSLVLSYHSLTLHPIHSTHETILVIVEIIGTSEVYKGLDMWFDQM